MNTTTHTPDVTPPRRGKPLPLQGKDDISFVIAMRRLEPVAIYCNGSAAGFARIAQGMARALGGRHTNVKQCLRRWLSGRNHIPFGMGIILMEQVWPAHCAEFQNQPTALNLIRNEEERQAKRNEPILNGDLPI